MFIDELEIHVQSGKGGNGCVSFRRERYVPFGGPNGGNGGPGGDVVLEINPAFNTLMPLRSLRHYRAASGKHGKGSNMTGASGQDLVLQVPPGTMVRERETGSLIGDLTKPGDRIIVAQGGRGGKGNAHFASSTHRTPRFSQPGEPGEERWLRLELKMMADVGLVGLPNAGKSTLIRHVSAARPKVSDYPFTTLEPSLGVVEASPFESFVIADIPGIIEGAHDGAGMGLRFLRHIERTNILLILIDPTDPEHPVDEAFDTLQQELRAYSSKLAHKPLIVALTKSDLPWEHLEGVEPFQQRLEREGIDVMRISSVKGKGLAALIQKLYDAVKQDRKAEPEELGPADVPPHKKATDPLDEI